MKNMRKHYANSIEEIEEFLFKQNRTIARQFVETCGKIHNDEVVLLYWNKLVELEQSQKLQKCLFASFALVTGAALGNAVASVLNNYKEIILPYILAQTAYTLSVGFINKFEKVCQSNLYQTIESMTVLEPELYDIGLVYNDWDKNKIDTSEYDGKKLYQQLNKDLNERVRQNNLDLEA